MNQWGFSVSHFSIALKEDAWITIHRGESRDTYEREREPAGKMLGGYWGDAGGRYWRNADKTLCITASVSQSVRTPLRPTLPTLLHLQKSFRPTRFFWVILRMDGKLFEIEFQRWKTKCRRCRKCRMWKSRIIDCESVGVLCLPLNTAISSEYRVFL